MNKKLILAGFVAVVGFVSLTAFDAKTLEQQKAEIAQMVTSKLNDYRTEMTAACDARVDAEAQKRYGDVLAARAAEAEAAAKSGVKPKKTTKGGATSKPLPPAKAPGKTAEEAAKDRMKGEASKANEEAAKDRMQGAPAKQDEKKAKSRMQGGGGK